MKEQESDESLDNLLESSKTFFIKCWRCYIFELHQIFSASEALDFKDQASAVVINNLEKKKEKRLYYGRNLKPRLIAIN